MLLFDKLRGETLTDVVPDMELFRAESEHMQKEEGERESHRH